MAAAVGGRRASLRSLLIPAALVGLLGLAVRLLYMADLAPVMYSPGQPGTRMAARYAQAAAAILEGDGVLYPRQWPDRSDTGLLSRPPGYPAVLAAIQATVGPSYFDVQLVQAGLTSLTAPLLLLLVARMLGRGPGLAAGLLAALSPPLGYAASLVTPDALSTLLCVVVTCLLWKGRRRIVYSVPAGVVAGLATWLRPNLLLLGPGLTVLLPVARLPLRRAILSGAVLTAAALAVVAPITIRNLRLYGELVPVSINMGIVLWEGIADAGGQRFGARRYDTLVALDEAERHGDPRYAAWWASPDGIQRDRERVRRSLAVIRENPLWFAGAAARRALVILDLESAATPLLASERPEPVTGSPATEAAALRPAAWIESVRAPLRALQRTAAALGPALRLLGLAAALLLAPRRTVFLLLVPLYVLLMQAPMHYEPRFGLSLHASFPVLEGMGWATAIAVPLRRARATEAARDRVRGSPRA
jgi:4-amino-4-deoxy-L-arabinose transferase-like glycosyltransferase